ncbi:MAG: rane fusion protein hemolysin [Chthoniobacter sp.]|jgi:multidrug resistance efflux pump|nr:rane fusion protein hemolysin [Chthoniobacter sp.]
MLPAEPPPFIVRSIAWLLIVMFCSAIAATIFVQVPETVRCPFVLVPKDGADPIQAPYLAVINEVHVAEAQEVAAGEELYVLHSDEIRMKHTQQRTLTEDLRAKEDSLEKSEASHAAQISIKDSEISQVERELTFRKKHADTSRNLVARLGKLAAGGGISQIELAKLELDLAQSEKDLSVAEKNLDSVKLERARLETERARQRSDEQAAVQNLKSRIEALRRDLESSKNDLLSVRAPYDAVVLSVARRSSGDVVQAGQELCQLARLNATPRARLFLKEQGMSRLAQGLRVRLFLDGFPYQRYGTVTGRLDWISPAAISSPEGPHFVATMSLDRTFIQVKGEPRPLRAGMKGEARIIVGSRRLVEYAFEPVRQLRENLRR